MFRVLGIYNFEVELQKFKLKTCQIKCIKHDILNKAKQISEVQVCLPKELCNAVTKVGMSMSSKQQHEPDRLL